VKVRIISNLYSIRNTSLIHSWGNWTHLGNVELGKACRDRKEMAEGLKRQGKSELEISEGLGIKVW